MQLQQGGILSIRDIRNHGTCVAHNAWFEGTENTVLFRVGGLLATDEQETALSHVDGFVMQTMYTQHKDILKRQNSKYNQTVLRIVLERASCEPGGRCGYIGCSRPHIDLPSFRSHKKY